MILLAHACTLSRSIRTYTQAHTVKSNQIDVLAFGICFDRIWDIHKYANHLSHKFGYRPFLSLRAHAHTQSASQILPLVKRFTFHNSTYKYRFTREKEKKVLCLVLCNVCECYEWIESNSLTYIRTHIQSPINKIRLFKTIITQHFIRYLLLLLFLSIY